MGTFKFRIYDVHHTLKVVEGELERIPLDGDLKTFHMVIDTEEITIVAFRSDTLLDSDNNPTEFTRVYLSDGSLLFAASKLETFEKNYREEYLPLFEKKE